MAQRYIERGGEQAYAPPFLQEDTRLKAFLLRADPKAMQRLLDRTLNGRPGMPVSYRALGHHILLAYAPIGSTRSTEPPDSEKGYTPETDVAFWMLTGAGREEDGTWVLERLAWFLPYVWVDVPTTMATGREVYGYPKELCWLRGPSASDPDLLFGVDTLVLPSRGPQTRLVRKPVIEVRSSGEEEPDEERRWSGPASALKHIFEQLLEEDGEDEDEGASIVPGWGLLSQLVESLAKAEVPMVFLKQIRDVVDPSQACYSAIIESTARVVGVPMGWPLSGSYEVLIQSYSSHPLLKDLGLSVGPNATGARGISAIRPTLAFEVRFDFEVGLGEVIWERGPGRR